MDCSTIYDLHTGGTLNAEQRLDRLEDAHRALAAQHTALLQVCRAMLPLIPANHALARMVLVVARDTTIEHMDTSNMDPAYQAMQREAFDLLLNPILAAADIRGRGTP